MARAAMAVIKATAASRPAALAGPAGSVGPAWAMGWVSGCDADVDGSLDAVALVGSSAPVPDGWVEVVSGGGADDPCRSAGDWAVADVAVEDLDAGEAGSAGPGLAGAGCGGCG